MTPPNIVLILVDDLGWTDVGCYASSFYETPHIDGLAASGVRFTQAYAASPVCSPSRAALLTGKYPSRVGITQFIGGSAVGLLADVPYFHELPENEYALSRALQDVGYRTWHIGKWHLGDGRSRPEAHGFDVNVGGGAPGHPSSYFSPYRLPALPEGPPGEYLTDRLTEEAVRLIHDHDGDAPFFLNLWHYTVHTPCQAPRELVEKYERKAERLGLSTAPVDIGEPMPAWHLAGRRVERRRYQSDPTYAAMVETLDTSVGRVVEALRATDRLDDTVIVFTSDNGGLSTAETSPTCNAPLAEGKGWLQDGGVRVPLIVSGPGITAGAESDALCVTPDLFTTLLTAGGDAPRHPVDGVDLTPALRGEPFDRGPIFWHYPHYSNQGGTPGAAVRDKNWKLVRLFEGHHLLFDVESDLGEEHDLFAIAPPEIRERLMRLLAEWLDDTGALIPERNPAGPAPWPPAQVAAASSSSVSRLRTP